GSVPQKLLDCPRICVCYIAVTNGPITIDYASRFVATWQEYQPGVSCDVLIVCNGGPLSTELSILFSPLDPRMFIRTNDPGWDCSAYLDAARGPCAEYDMMLCLGESNYFHRSGWLARLVEAWQRYGPGMYSPYSSNAVRAHMNTTAFMCAPQLLRNYTAPVNTRMDRYSFEHGERSLWRRAAEQGLPVRMVTWDGEWGPRMWRMPQNILWRGDQSNLLMQCNHSDGYFNADARTKAAWARRCDAPFR
ncbi:MAG TPA: hypothetical protein VMQ76_02745, partial [Terracidiphilus sp.]|nr:hypothetical protein [Terracidiphilus sp.]